MGYLIEKYEVNLGPEMEEEFPLPRTPGRDIEILEVERNSSQESEGDLIQEKEITEEIYVLVEEEQQKSNKKCNKTDKNKKKDLEIEKVEPKKRFKGKPRPVMEPTSEEEIATKFRRDLPKVDKNMKHSLRFWLAVRYIRKRKVGKLTACKHFDVEKSGVYRVIKKEVKAKDSMYFSPGEWNKKSQKRVIARCGREEDKKKYLEGNGLKEFARKYYI